jgi:pimeloyl-ACP methyl ester carboxylesterase
MEQLIRFGDLEGKRIAYATVGEGPPLVFAAPWVSHLEADWEDADTRAFFEELAQTHRVIRYNRLGTGLSDRSVVEHSVEQDAATLAAVMDACVEEAATVWACACGAAATVGVAAAQPERVKKLVFFGAYAARDDIPDVTRRSLVDFARTNWPLAAQLLAGLTLPRSSGDEIAACKRYQRRSADADAAASILELDLVLNLRPLLPRVRHPSLVLHRRNDRVVPIGRGRELASLLPNARFVPLSGDAHLPWKDDQRELRRALAGFLDDAPRTEPNGKSPLTRRELEILRLVAKGLSNREIAGSLVLSEHTVHRHVANILRKLAQSSRAAATAHAARLGLI